MTPNPDASFHSLASMLGSTCPSQIPLHAGEPGHARGRFFMERQVERKALARAKKWRSEEHTSELQSRLHLVCRLLLEKKKQVPAQCCRFTENGRSGLAGHHSLHQSG